jgi:hypothetical protein
MRTALLLSGKLRYSLACLSNLQTNIIDVFQPDIFCSFWDDTPKKIEELYFNSIKPTLIELENFNLLYNQFLQWYPFNIYKNLVPMVYKHNRANTLKNTYEITNNFSYDFVIKARTDSLFYEKISSDDVNHCLENKGVKTTLIYSPDIDPYVNPRRADENFMGDNDSMNLTAKTFWLLRDQLIENYNLGKHFHNRIPEIIQSQIWNKLGVKVSTLSGTKNGQLNWELDRNYL